MLKNKCFLIIFLKILIYPHKLELINNISLIIYFFNFKINCINMEKVIILIILIFEINLFFRNFFIYKL